MAAKKRKSKKDPRLARVGVSGYNKPKRTPKHPTKSHCVMASEGGKYKFIRFGQQANRKKVSQKNKKQEESHLKQDMPKILREARCQQLTGQIVKNGK